MSSYGDKGTRTPNHSLKADAPVGPRLLYTANCCRGLVPKDAESMGREREPLLDFNSK
jgi:hypothetical protein